MGRAGRTHARPPRAGGQLGSALHQTGLDRLLLPLGNGRFAGDSSIALLERAIGVIYRPETERASHHFHAQLAAQFDALIHIDRTTAVQPLEITPQWQAGEPPETYPTGI